MDIDDYDSLPEAWPMRIHLVAGAAAGVLEHACMYPVDCVKTRMQSVTQVRYKGVFNALSTIYAREGSRRLFRGMSVMVIGAGPAHAMYFSCYEQIKHRLTTYLNSGLRSKNSSLANGIAGASATIFHDIVMNPADVIKQRMQMYGSPYQTIVQCIKETRTEGLRAFYRSFPTQLLMNIPFQTVHFVMYELTQEQLNPKRIYNPLSHMASGAVAGASAAFITNPMDICRTLLNTQEFKNQHQNQRDVIIGLRQAIVTVFRTDGFATFFRGVTARVLYQMPSTAISWSIYELFKHLLSTKELTSISDCSTHPRDVSFKTTPVCAAPSHETILSPSVIGYKET